MMSAGACGAGLADASRPEELQQPLAAERRTVGRDAADSFEFLGHEGVAERRSVSTRSVGALAV